MLYSYLFLLSTKWTTQTKVEKIHANPDQPLRGVGRYAQREFPSKLLRSYELRQFVANIRSNRAFATPHAV